MSREIIFKAKRIESGEWAEGSLIFLDVDSGYYLIKTSYPGASTRPVRLLIDEHTFFVKPETICQYTGLTDKNGNKIWENDVIQEDFGNYRGAVVFGEFESNVLNNLGFSINWSDSGVYYRQDLPYWADKIEVVGNIFDNPKLLEVHK